MIIRFIIINMENIQPKRGQQADFADNNRVKRVRQQTDEHITAAAQVLKQEKVSSVTPAEAEEIIGSDEMFKIAQFLSAENYLEMNGYTEDKPFHIRGRDVPESLGGPFKFSLIIQPSGQALILLKGKAREDYRAKLRAKGYFKSVKPASDIQKDTVVANYTYDVDQAVNRRLGNYRQASRSALLGLVLKNESLERAFKKEVFGNPDSATKIDLLKHLEKNFSDNRIRNLLYHVAKEAIVKEVKNEYSYTNEADYFCEYESEPTAAAKQAQRLAEGKTLRLIPHSIISFSVPLAEGTLDSPDIEKATLENPEQFAKCFRDLSSELHDLHAQDIVHQDIKLDNILLYKDGNFHHSDFGRAANVNENSTIQGGSLPITDPVVYRYIHSQNKGERPDLKKSDVYSLGLAYYQLITHAPTLYTKQVNGLIQKVNDIKQKYEDLIVEEIEAGLPGKVNWDAVAQLEQQGKQEKEREIDQFLKQITPDKYRANIAGNLNAMKCPENLITLITSMLALNPEERPDMDEVNSIISEIDQIELPERELTRLFRNVVTVEAEIVNPPASLDYSE